MAGAPVAARHEPWMVRAARGLGGFLARAVFGYGLAVSLALVVFGTLLFVGFNLITAGIAVTVVGVAVGLVFTMAQGAPV